MPRIGEGALTGVQLGHQYGNELNKQKQQEYQNRMESYNQNKQFYDTMYNDAVKSGKYDETQLNELNQRREGALQPFQGIFDIDENGQKTFRDRGVNTRYVSGQHTANIEASRLASNYNQGEIDRVRNAKQLQDGSYDLGDGRILNPQQMEAARQNISVWDKNPGMEEHARQTALANQQLQYHQNRTMPLVYTQQGQDQWKQQRERDIENSQNSYIKNLRTFAVTNKNGLNETAGVGVYKSGTGQ